MFKRSVLVRLSKLASQPARGFTDQTFSQVESLIDKFKSKPIVNKKRSSVASSADPLITNDTSHDNYMIRVIGNGHSGTPKSILLQVNGQSYLFNCGESTSRIIVDMNLRGKLAKLNNVFFTRGSWTDCVSGVFELLYRLINDFKLDQVKFHAPFPIESFLYQVYNLLCIKNVDFEQHEYNSANKFTYSHGDIKVEVLYLNQERSDQAKTPSPVYDSLLKLNAHKKYQSDLVHAYVCTINEPALIRFNEACDSLGVPYQKRAKLKRMPDRVFKDKNLDIREFIRHNLQNSNQTEANVTRNDNEPIQFYKILVLDVPDERYLSSLLLYSFFESLTNLDVIIHMSPNHILNHVEYKKFIKSLIDFRNVDHIFLDETMPNLASYSIYEQQHLHSLLDSEIFRPMRPPKFPRDLAPIHRYKEHFQTYNKVLDGKTSSIYNLNHRRSMSGQQQFNSRLFSWFNTQDLDSEVNKKMPNYKELVKKFTRTSSKTFDNSKASYPAVVFLGSSSAESTNYRNMSGVLVNVSENSSILLDCSEGTLGQLIKYYGENKYMKELVKVKAIFVSHLHTDHHQGVYSFINRRRQAFDELNRDYKKVYLCAPSNLFSYFAHVNSLYLNSVKNNEGVFLDSTTIIDNDWLLGSMNQNEPERRVKSMIKELGLKSLETVPVSHVQKSTGIVIVGNDGFKLVYTGDCSANNNLDLLQRGMNCDLLIHEATYDNEHHVAAEYRAHSTVAQAVRVGQRMQARHICLTHFGTHLARQPEKLYEHSNQVIIAQDFMRLDPRNLSTCKALSHGLRFLSPFVDQ